MYKKISLLMAAASIVLLFSFTLFSQDSDIPADTDISAEIPDDSLSGTETPVADGSVTEPDGVIEADSIDEALGDSPAEGVIAVIEEETIPRRKAKSYSDGFNTYINNKVKFELTTEDNIYKDNIFYKLDDGADAEYKESFGIDAEGKHAIIYYSVDKMGNREDVQTISVIVDNTPPDVQLTVKAPFVKSNDNIYIAEAVIYSYSMTAQDTSSGVANIQYSLDAKNYAEYVGSFEVSSKEPVQLKIVSRDNVDNFNEKFVTKIVDAEGNVLGTAEDIKILVDNTLPTVAIASDKEFVNKDGKKIASKAYKYSVTADDKESGIIEVLYRVDRKGDFIPYTQEIILTSNGNHVIEAISKDKVGNMSQTAELRVFVDVIPSESKIRMVTDN
ncbi:MAG: hypothetical protein GY754_43590 [bacterium]|nr:hypothetical protein [bacterium]